MWRGRQPALPAKKYETKSCLTFTIYARENAASLNETDPLPSHTRSEVRSNRKTKEVHMSTAQAPAINMDQLNAFLGKFVGDVGASVHAGMVVIGEKLGLYKALADCPATSEELSKKTGTDERYLREWLASQAAGGYITYDADSRRFSLTPEQAFTLASED